MSITRLHNRQLGAKGHTVDAEPVGYFGEILQGWQAAYQQCPCRECDSAICCGSESLVILGHAEWCACLSQVLLTNRKRKDKPARSLRSHQISTLPHYRLRHAGVNKKYYYTGMCRWSLFKKVNALSEHSRQI